MKHMTVGKKIGFAGALLVAMTIALGVASLINVKRMARYQEATVSDAMPGVYDMGRVMSLANDMRSRMLLHIASSNPQDAVRFEGEIASFRERVKAAMKEYEKTIFRAEDREGFSKIEPAFDRWFASWEPVRLVSRQGKNKEAFAMFQQNVTPPMSDLQKAINDEIEQNKRFGDECTLNSSNAASSANWWIWGLLGSSLVTGGGLGFYIVLGINGALKQSAAELTEGARQITSAAGQVASSSQSLAQGASEQAASLEETSASIEEISSMTRRNAENSQSAATVMTAVDQNVQNGNRTLDQMVVSMQEINASSGKISKIIKVIDEIAFQTNILALNAAVEAARAGEAGMGFAVVADEVRNLAQRSAQAAKDTAGLIEESIVAEVIRAITDSATKVKTLVDEVNLGSQEQARGIDEISKAINQMNQVTQSTAANAEESASASEELSAQAEALNQVVVRLGSLVDAGEAHVETWAPGRSKQQAANGRDLHALRSSISRETPAVRARIGAGKTKAGRTATSLDDEFTEM
jgi:methyl-accepting chemotaxis protein